MLGMNDQAAESLLRWIRQTHANLVQYVRWYLEERRSLRGAVQAAQCALGLELRLPRPIVRPLPQRPRTAWKSVPP